LHCTHPLEGVVGGVYGEDEIIFPTQGTIKVLYRNATPFATRVDDFSSTKRTNNWHKFKNNKGLNFQKVRVPVLRPKRCVWFVEAITERAQ